MNVEAVLGKITELMNSDYVVLIFVVCVIAFYVTHKSLKSKRIKSLKADERLKDAALFGTAISSPMAISGDGYIGVIRSAYAEPVIFHLTTVKGYQVYFDGHIIAGSGERGPADIIFKNALSYIEANLREKTKKINLLFFTTDTDHPVINAALYNGSARIGSTIKETAREEIKALFNKLEEMEARVKGQGTGGQLAISN